MLNLFLLCFTARVGPSVPRQERPTREGARVASIETGLAAAAAKLSHQVNNFHLPFLPSHIIICSVLSRGTRK